MESSEIEGWNYYFDKIVKRITKEECFDNKKLTSEGIPIIIKKKSDIKREGYEIKI